MDQPNGSQLMRPARDVGLIGYGAYVPRFRLPASEVARVWTEGASALPIKEKAVPGLDEDVATMSIEAARNARDLTTIVAKVEAVGPSGYVTDLSLLENRFEFARHLKSRLPKG